MANPTLEERMALAREWVHGARRVAVLTGAGVSAESGVPTYRGAGGLWSGFTADDVASPEAFARNPQAVWQWHNGRRLRLKDARPNAAHRALAQWGQRLADDGGRLVLATQNIDGLHQAGGSRNVLELHGTILAVRCSDCPERKFIGFAPMDDVPRCPACAAFMRPAIVWFGEMLPEDAWQGAAEAAMNCDLFLTVGTSAVVYPAAGLIEMAVRAGARTLEVNLEPTAASRVVHLALHGKAGEILPQMIA